MPWEEGGALAESGPAAAAGLVARLQGGKVAPCRAAAAGWRGGPAVCQGGDGGPGVLLVSSSRIIGLRRSTVKLAITQGLMGGEPSSEDQRYANVHRGVQAYR